MVYIILVLFAIVCIFLTIYAIRIYKEDSHIRAERKRILEEEEEDLFGGKL
ncbi:MAG TPA: hypothetical protein PK977_07900 [Chitinophagaceae bacterium]|nr:hypothetical protein [Chitinophagaceae bacterium]HRF18076.1 hypothetical protein [Chitinophagaceae bacterium]